MLITGIIGYPLKTTLSPCLHNLLFREFRLEGVYLSMPVRKEQLQNAVYGLKALGFRGVNITTPYKRKVFDLLDDIDKNAEEVDAVNTIEIKNSRLIGYNTDIYGFKQSLIEYGITIKHKKVLLLGAGGAAHACGYVINSSAPKEFFVANQTVKKAREFSGLFNAEAVDLDRVAGLIPEMDLVVNATSVDLQHRIIDHMVPGAVYYDLNYTYKLTEKSGVRIINGKLMLLLQGIRSFKIWTEKEPVKINGLKKTMGVQ